MKGKKIDDNDPERLRWRLRPTTEDQRNAERELADGDDEPLDPAWVEGAIARAVAGGRPRWRRSTWVAVAAVVLLLLVPSAWMTRRVLWPEARNSHLTLSIADAHGLLEQTAENEGKRMSALATICDRLIAGLTTMKDLAASTSVADAEIAARATAILNTAADILDGKAGAMTVYVADSWVADAERAQDGGAPTAARLEALDRCERMMHAGLHAVISLPLNAAQPQLTRGRDVVLRHLRREVSQQSPRQGAGSE